MDPILTTITPYWNRPSTLRAWFKGVEGATIPGVEHRLVVIGDETLPRIPDFVQMERKEQNLASIGHWHNHVAATCKSEWIMKLDSDTIPNMEFFKTLLPVLASAVPHEWFNCGMVYANVKTSQTTLADHSLPLQVGIYDMLMGHRQPWTDGAYNYPAATNFICRREDYLMLGGCEPGFRGYGWEDYQQIYMLEKWQRGMDPLPGEVNLENVTHRCRDEISRPKARTLWQTHPRLALLHRWHSLSPTPGYRSRKHMDANRSILLNYIRRAKNI